MSSQKLKNLLIDSLSNAGIGANKGGDSNSRRHERLTPKNIHDIGKDKSTVASRRASERKKARGPSIKEKNAK
jgi:hypothetical protein